MKTAYLLPALGLLPALVALAPAPPATILSGHLAHAPAADSVRLEYGSRRAAAALSPAGDFRLVLRNVEQPTRATFSYGGQLTYLWLSPGDQQHLTLDFPKFDQTVQYSGRGSAASNYLARSLYRFEFGEPAQASPFNRISSDMAPADFKLTPGSFRQQEDTYRQQRQDFLAAYAQAHPLPAAFRRDQQQVIDVQWASELLFFPSVLNWFHRDDAVPPALPASYFDFLAQLPLRQWLAQPTEAIKPELKKLGYAYLNRLLPGGHLSPDPAEAGRLYALATTELGATPARDQVMYELLHSNLIHDLPGVEAAYPTFRAQNRDSTLAGQLRQQMAARRLLEPGQPAPDFTLRDNMGREVSLRDLRGKVVYLDFWGTWCPPCMTEMTRYSHALKQQFEGRDVAFVYVSVRDTEAQWQRVLADKQLTSANSVHLRAPDAAVANRYQVPYYPSYYLIGRDGRFVQAYTLRPSDGPKTVALIEAALSAPPAGSAQ